MKLKKIISFLVIAVMLCLPMMTAFAADTTTTGSDGTTATIPVTGTIEATSISVTHPLTVSYAINANTGVLTAAPISVKNNTTVPISVSVDTLAAAAGGTITFTDVAASTYADWTTLSKADTLKYIALGVGITDAAGWTAGYSTATHYAVDVAALTFGTLAGAATGNLAITGSFGRAFGQSYTANHSLVLRFNLT